MIQRPYILAEKPQDYTGLEGQVITANVHSVSGAKKRKRSELAAAIDHQGINIYDVCLSSVRTARYRLIRPLDPKLQANYFLCCIASS